MTAAELPSVPTLTAIQPCRAPTWALLQRRLLTDMSQAALRFVDRYTRPDGTLYWRAEWPGMDASDDLYEGFHNLPLLYLLGGDDRLLPLAHHLWDAITWQTTEYGQVYREFDAYYDWMHHGEGSLYLYYLGLAGPWGFKERQRATRFADFYTGADPAAPNYDRERRLLRSPLTGSRGPRLEVTAEDFETLREVYEEPYGSPFEDLPDTDGRLRWTDDAVFGQILGRFNARLARGDVPLNLLATSLVAHGYLYTGAAAYRDWIVEYLSAWAERARQNGGIIPDNVGLSGHIGEYLDGRWWGGYYGWRWPHGGYLIMEALTVAGMNAALVTGDLSHLTLIRDQLARLWQLGREIDGVWHLPNKYRDGRWTDFLPADRRFTILLWSVSQSAEDRAAIERVPAAQAEDMQNWPRQLRQAKMDAAHTQTWYRFITGGWPDYPEHVLRLALERVRERLALIQGDAGDPATWTEGHWIRHNPVTCEALVQTMLGAPMPVYHGGLLHCPVRYFDDERRRPGLPLDVGALVDSVDDTGVSLTLVNLNLERDRTVTIQAGGFGEHHINAVTSGDDDQPIAVGGRWLRLALGPGAGVRLRLTLSRFAYSPRYGPPWGSPLFAEPLIRGRATAPDGPLRTFRR